jgi:hypothetical protein
MSIDQPPTLPTDLQFDRAVFEGNALPSLACRLCDQPISGTYYDVNGQPTCESCRDVLAVSLGVDSGLRGIVTALASGVGAGVAGALLYYAVVALTGYEIGLIAVAVGFMVGHAVKWGSSGRGGRRFQIMAVAITYVAIVSTYVPFIVAGINQAQTSATATTSADTRPASANVAPAPGGSSSAAPAASAQKLAPPLGVPPVATEAPPTLGEFVIGLAMLSGLLLALPFLGGFQNIMGLLIIGFALWEAWKVNRRVVLSVAGPFVAGPHAPPVDGQLSVPS